jgi:hypothetical protein
MLFGKCGDLRLDARELLLSVGQFRDQRQQNARGEFIQPLGIHLSARDAAIGIDRGHGATNREEGQLSH